MDGRSLYFVSLAFELSWNRQNKNHLNQHGKGEKFKDPKYACWSAGKCEIWATNMAWIHGDFHLQTLLRFNLITISSYSIQGVMENQFTFFKFNFMSKSIAESRSKYQFLRQTYGVKFSIFEIKRFFSQAVHTNVLVTKSNRRYQQFNCYKIKLQTLP